MASRFFHKSNKSAEADLVADRGHPDPKFLRDSFPNPVANIRFDMIDCNPPFSYHHDRDEIEAEAIGQ